MNPYCAETPKAATGRFESVNRNTEAVNFQVAAGSGGKTGAPFFFLIFPAPKSPYGRPH